MCNFSSTSSMIFFSCVSTSNILPGFKRLCKIKCRWSLLNRIHYYPISVTALFPQGLQTWRTCISYLQDYIAGRSVIDAHFGRHHHHVILSDVETRRAQAVSAKQKFKSLLYYRFIVTMSMLISTTILFSSSFLHICTLSSWLVLHPATFIQRYTYSSSQSLFNLSFY